ncbi:hypothetical protein [Cellulomonas sp. SG140]|uniref:hypothetical protein n=1 Tax=Cellulomonas sp. SG140 TaxID=2976536 RepID=UPI0021E6FB55|nr:hypothetical protein [Cellulomonas sp. SG140]
MDDSSAALTFVSGATATVSWDADRVPLSLAGEVDEYFSDAGASMIELVAGLDRPVHVDLCGVTLFTAAGVSWLVALYDGIPHPVRVVAAAELVLDVLAVCRVATSSPGRGRGAAAQGVGAHFV